MKAARSTRILGAIHLTIALCLPALSAHAQYGGGTGEPNDPYLIYTAEQMNEIGLHEEDWDKHFKLMADIDLSTYTGSTFNVIGTRAIPSRRPPIPMQTGKPFAGTFDGNGHAISNFTWSSDEKGHVGLFGHVSDPNAEIKNITLIEPNITVEGHSIVGPLVGELRSGSVTNCHVTGGIVSGNDESGGLVGRNSGAAITTCSATATVTGRGQVGGLVGQNSSGTVTDCHCAGTVSGEREVGGLVGANSSSISSSYSTSKVRGNDTVGGLVGQNSSGTVTDCYSTGAVTGEDSVGGLVGDNGGTIMNCCSRGGVAGVAAVGGVAGHHAGRITNSYSSANVTGEQDVGGLVGMNVPGSITDPITNCYSTGTVDGAVNVGGLIGSDLWPGPDRVTVTRSFWDVESSGREDSASGEGKTTAQMKTAVTFLAWTVPDNDGTWTIDEGNDYPRLWWEHAPGTPIQPAHLAGTGTEDDPYLIYTVCELSSIGLLSSARSKHFKLMAHIDLSVHTGTTFNIIRSFSGVFDGGGHVISDFTYILPDLDETLYPAVGYVGLFGSVAPNGEIKNLGMVNPNVNARKGYYVGALVGDLGYGTVINCYVDGGTVTASAGGWDGVGGLVGHNENGAVVKCYATAAVFGNSAVGGLVGYNGRGGVVTDSYARGNVTGSEFVGGLVGSDYGDYTLGGAIILNCYSTGRVTGNDSTGGLVGYSWGGRVSGCFWDTVTSGQQAGDIGLGLTTAEMQRAGTFRGWIQCGEEATWMIDDGSDYPRLAWEDQPGELIAAISLADLLAGTGAEDDPYLIYTAEDLCLVGWAICEWDKHFKLMADIDLSARTETAFDPIGMGRPFTGVFDGNGHAIANFSYACTDAANAGLFGYVRSPPFEGPNAEVKNLRLTDPNLDAGKGDCIGSLVGYLSRGTVTSCHVEDGNVSGDDRIGGLVGYLNGGSVIDSSATGTITGHDQVGGLVGEMVNRVRNCCSVAKVMGNEDVGGLVGCNHFGSIADCYAKGNVTGANRVGGITGRNGYTSATNEYPATISNSYSTCDVSGDAETTGGLVGLHMIGEVISCFWDLETSGQTTSDGGMARTVAEMQTATTFLEAGWDFIDETENGNDDIWWILEGQDYPRLWWEAQN